MITFRHYEIETEFTSPFFSFKFELLQLKILRFPAAQIRGCPVTPVRLWDAKRTDEREQRSKLILMQRFYSDTIRSTSKSVEMQ